MPNLQDGSSDLEFIMSALQIFLSLSLINKIPQIQQFAKGGLCG